MIRHPRAATSRARRPPRRRHPRRPRLDAKRRTRRAGRAFESEQAPTIARVLHLLAAAAPDLGRWLSLGLALLTVAMLQLWRGARRGHGGLTLCALSRTLPLDEPEKARSKRLYRLLRNPALDGTEMTPLLVRLALGATPCGWIPIVVDQTTVQGTQVIMAGVRVAHRILPVAFVCYEYDKIRKSQNLIEYSLLLLIASCLPPGCKPVYVMDRGYARASLLKCRRPQKNAQIWTCRPQHLVDRSRSPVGLMVARARPCKGSSLRSDPATRGFGLDRDSARASEQLWRPLGIDRRCADFRVFR